MSILEFFLIPFLFKHQNRDLDLNSFDSSVNLKYILLDHNKIAEPPFITNLPNLLVYDISSQRVPYLDVNAYTFDRRKPISNLQVNMVQAITTKYDLKPKAFCSRAKSSNNNNNQIGYVQFSSGSFQQDQFKSACRLAELKNARLDQMNVDANGTLKFDYSINDLVCNCFMRSFLAHHGVELFSSCPVVADTCTVDHFSNLCPDDDDEYTC